MNRVRALWAPPPTQTVSQWAEEHLRLSPEDSAEPGRYTADRAPFQRGIMDACSDPDIETVVVKSAAQVGKTTVIKAIIGYHVHQDPSPILVLQPTLEMAETFSKDRLAPMVRDTEALRDKIAPPNSKNSGNTITHKRFPGGHITIVGANSASGLASRPIRIVLCDEVDRYPASAGTEGDPVSLATKRSATFWNRKLVLTSTPTKLGLSRIDAAYQQSDQRRYHVPCPACGHYHALEWALIRYAEAEPLAARMACPECGALWGDADKPRMLQLGRWVAGIPGGTTAGFHLSELYSPWRTLGQVAQDYERAKASPEQLKTWWNTSLGECYEEPGEAPEWQRLYDRRETWTQAPAGVTLLTCGVDVQGDRLELAVVGWAPGKQSYLVDYRMIVGNTADLGPGGPWAELQALISTETWPTEAGPALGLRFTAVDSGYRSSVVYEFCRRFPAARVAPVKGRDDMAFVISPPRAIDRKATGRPMRGVKLYSVGSSVIKNELYGWMRLDRAEDGSYPPGYIHLSEDRDQQWCKELTSEKLQTKYIKGFPKEHWVRDPALRNEPLDCYVYARAAAAIAGMDRWRERDWTAQGAPPAAPAPVTVVEVTQARAEQPAAPKQRRQSSFWR